MQPAAAVRTTCPYCGVGCGILAQRDGDLSVSIAGDPDHPANFGRLCSKGSALAETVGHEGRLLYPEILGRRAGWDAALALIANRFTETIAAHGPDAVAFYVSGQLLTEDYYVANKLMKGFIGAANIDTNSRLCMASSVAGHRRAFGADIVPGCYEDIEEADLVVLVGSNLAWCHPVLYQRLVASREARPGTRIVVIDPRRTATAASADLHLPIAPDADVALFVGLLASLAAGGAIDRRYVAEHTRGLDDALAVAERYDLGRTAEFTGLDRDDLATFFRWFAETDRVVTVYSQGVNQSVSGTDKVNAIINCHLATGRIATPGAGPFSVTGQPNAMGGREVGGLANQLACHLDLDNAAHREIARDFWKAPRVADRPGLKAVDLFDAVADGRVKALWIMATNPVDSMPDADRVKAALAVCPLVVVSDVVADNDTAPFAHIRLPAAAWGEKNGTVTNSERRISRQRRFLPSVGQARPDWWIVSGVACRMGFCAAFDYPNAAAIFREYAAFTAAANPDRPLNLAGLGNLDHEAYDALDPVQWPCPDEARPTGAQRVFGDGRFATGDGRARFVPTPHRGPAEATSAALPMVLNTGRVRDHWHTLTRTGRSPRLWNHIAEPYAEIARADADAMGIASATIVRISNRRGSVLVRALVNEAQRPGSVFVPMHWTGQYAGSARVDALVGPAVDPVSGQPGLKHTPVNVTPAAAAWYGFAVLRADPRTVAADYWALARTKRGFRLEIAGLTPLEDPAAFAAELFGLASPAPFLSYCDSDRRRFRYALEMGGEVRGAVYFDTEPVAVSRSWAVEMMDGAEDGTRAALRLLAGRPGTDRPEQGAIVCSCNLVGANRVAAAVAAGATSLSMVAAATGAGANCGSCRPELLKLLPLPEPALG